VGERLYETGVDHGVLYQLNEAGEYVDGVAWNGLTTVTESPSGAESNKQYADNIVYVNLISVEEFGGTIEAFTYPDEFGQNDGTDEPAPGVQMGQQGRRPFGLVYRTLVGNDVDGQEHGYKLHLLYGCLASPSEKAYSTVNDSPEAIAFSWEFTTTPAGYTDGKPTSLIVVDSTKVDPTDLAALEDILFGTVSDDPSLPAPDAIVDLFTTGLTTVDLGTAANQPTYNAGTHVVTIPVVTGVTWTINGVEVATGAQPAMSVGETSEVQAHADAGYNLEGNDEWTFDY
jgi:hypothetical protein